MRHNLMDLDTTIAYDAAEQQTDSPDTDLLVLSSIDGAQTSSVSDSKDTDPVAPSSIDGAQLSSVPDLPDESHLSVWITVMLTVYWLVLTV